MTNPARKRLNLDYPVEATVAAPVRPTPEVSRAVAAVKTIMELSPGPVLDELVAAANTADTPDDLPVWARNALGAAQRQRPTEQPAPNRPSAARSGIAEAAQRMGDDSQGGITITPPPRRR